MTRMLLLWLALLLGGCSWLGLSGLDIESVGISAQKPSNVAVYLRADNRDEPLTELALGSFRIYENDQLLSSEEIDLRLLDRTVAVEHHTLLLVDMGVESEQTRRSIAKGVPGFVQKVRRSQGVTVYAFDGSPRPTLIGEFPRSPDSTEPTAVPELESFKPSDTSRDLHSAIVEGMKQLDARLMRAQKPLRVGTLVVFTRGLDLAGRVTAEDMQTQLDATRHQVLALGVGEDESDGLDDIGRDGVVRAHSTDTIGIGFEDVAAKVDAALRRHYLLAYCSPARAGARSLRVEVTTVDSDGEQVVGDVELQFDATGFGPGCDASATPRFVMSAKTQPSEVPPTTGGGEDGAAETAGPGEAKDGGDEAEGGTEEDVIAPPPDRPVYAPE